MKQITRTTLLLAALARFISSLTLAQATGSESEEMASGNSGTDARVIEKVFVTATAKKRIK